MLRADATPDFVPHEQWGEFSWLAPLAERLEPWYYASPRDVAPEERTIPEDPGFLDTVDPAIRRLVAWLHSRGVPTGPSCAGHELEDETLKEIFRGLELDALEVSNGGLKLRDPEDGKLYLLEDPGYELPWDQDSFVRRARAHQRRGWLPFYTTDPRTGLLVGDHDGFEIRQTGDDSFGVWSSGRDPRSWEKATNFMIGRW